ncbi:peptide chain release factor N(5)-glutamine methyltransferase [Kaarinaea lacus]
MPELTIKQALEYGCDLLRQQQQARLEAEILLAYCLKHERVYLRTWPDKSLPADVIQDYQQLLQRRCSGEPIAYLTGTKEFWDLTLKVSPAVLIPRPETEHLVELALERIPTDAPWHIADLGTGSGAIALAIAKHRPQCQLWASDVCPDALAIAQQNAQLNGIDNISFGLGPWFVPWSQPHAPQKFNLIASNPPYVAAEDPHLHQGDLRFEPQQALSSGDQGLDAIKEIVSRSPRHLHPGGWLLIEHGYDQGQAVMALFKQHGFEAVFCHQDYADRERVTLGKLSS